MPNDTPAGDRSSSALRFDVFGVPRLRSDGKPITLRAPRQAIALLAYLALHRARTVPRDELAFALWPDEREETALANLRRYLSRFVRQLLPPAAEPWLTVTPRGVAWNGAADVDFDVAAFERLAPCAAAGDGAAIALYTGDVLESFDDAWIAPHRARLRALFLSASMTCAAARRAAGDPRGALDALARRLGLDPLDEEALQTSLVLREELGDRTGALSQYHAFTERSRLELGVAPSRETTAIYERIVARLRADLRASTASGPELDLPRPPTAFHGRPAELAEIGELLTRRREITLCGIGGMGKTRLALEVAASLRDCWPDGIVFVAFDALVDPALTVATVGAALGLRDGDTSQPPLSERVARALRPKRSLIVLDSCEHVRHELAALLNQWLSTCPDIRAIVTSREPLGFAGECIYHVPPLDRSAALEMFADRAQLQARTFASERHEPLVDDIVGRLDGVPLAIELAASRVGGVSLERIAAGLEEAVGLRASSLRARTDGRKTIGAVMRWSYDLLDPQERRLFERLACFSGGWTIAAARDVCGDDDVTPDVVEAVLASLVDRSLVLAQSVNDGSLRYRFLEPVRTFARDRLADSQLADRYARRHADFFRQFGLHVLELFDRTWARVSIETARPERDNIRTALSWSLHDGNDVLLGQQLSAAVQRCWDGAFVEGLGWVDEALAVAGETTPIGVLADLYAARSALCMQRLQIFEVIEYATRAADLYRSTGDMYGLGVVTQRLAGHLIGSGRVEEGLPIVNESLSCNEATGNDRAALWCRANLATAAGLCGDVARARDILDDLRERRRGKEAVAPPAIDSNLAEVEFLLGNVGRALELNATLVPRESVDSLHELARTCNRVMYLTAADRFDDARTAAAAALESSVRRQAGAVVPLNLQHIAMLAARTGKYELAARLLGHVETELARLGCVRQRTEDREASELRGILEAQLGSELVVRLLADGALGGDQRALHHARNLLATPAGV